MANSLQDQLRQLGLVDEKKAHKAANEKRKRHRQSRGKAGSKAGPPAGRPAVKADKVERDRALNREREAKAAQKSVFGQIRQLIASNKQSREGGDVAYNFVHDKAVKRLYLPKPLHEGVSRGTFAIVWFDRAYEVVPIDTAEKIAEREASCVLVDNRAAESSAPEDDPYADYQVPDDLMW